MVKEIYKSKFEILKFVEDNDIISITQIANEFDFNNAALKKCLLILQDQGEIKLQNHFSDMRGWSVKRIYDYRN